MSRRKKALVAVYVGGVVLNQVVSTYNEGKTALDDFRRSRTKDKTEWDAVWTQCRKWRWSRLMDSVMWPSTLAGSMMPYVVLWMNPVAGPSPPPLPPSVNPPSLSVQVTRGDGVYSSGADADAESTH